jgi:SAM-dependent methyltransferase
MDKQTVRKLVALNSEFYQTFAQNFSATRMRLQSGVVKILETLDKDADILDLGCGNGELAVALAQRGHQGRYLGIDFSAELIALANEKLDSHPDYVFIQDDLAVPGWEQRVLEIARTEMGRTDFEVIFSFAVLHHLPGVDLHRRILQNVHTLLSWDGCFIHSNWQFLNSPRLRKRIQPWEEIELTIEDVDPGDFLLDWRQGGRGLRYVHHFDEDELSALATDTGFLVADSFFSDGEGGNLGLYQIWEKTD